MQRLLPLTLFVAVGNACLCTHATADGLIFSLPPDGTWAEFSAIHESTCQISLPDGIKLSEYGKAKSDAFSRQTKTQGTIRALALTRTEEERAGGLSCDGRQRCWTRRTPNNLSLLSCSNF
jgi:hypothetical protein